MSRDGNAASIPMPGGVTFVEGPPDTIKTRLEDIRGDLKMLTADLLRHDDIEQAQDAIAAVCAVSRVLESVRDAGLSDETWGLQHIGCYPPGIVRHAED